MDIEASYKWLKEYLGEDFEPKRFSKEVTAKSFPVDYTKSMKGAFDGIVVGEILSIEKHANADSLNLAKVDIGKDDPIALVFGSKVVMEVGYKIPVAVAPMVLPGGLEIKKSKIRGEVSEGMLCLDQELGLCDKGMSIRFFEEGMKNGTPLDEALDIIDDTIFDVEITSNRVDSMGIVGLAREAGAAMGIPFTFTPPTLPEAGSGKEIKVDVLDTEGCSRYMAVVIDGVKVAPSPAWLQTKLLLSGHRPINNIVDITNYVLHEFGQPMHAFDYEKLKDGKIVVRRAKKGEKIKALDDETYELAAEDLVIADSDKPIAVAGVMGGSDTGTWDGTTTIVFESATFDGLSVRKTARRHHLYSDSQLLFEKGLSSEAPEAALARAIELTLELAGGAVASEIIDERSSAYEPLVFPFRPQKARDLMGVDLSNEKMIDLLERVGFKVDETNGTYSVIVPFWRDHDIEEEVDLTEEIARLYGYHNMPAELPDSPPPTTPEDPALVWEMRTKKLLVGFGYTELYGYSMISAQDIIAYDLDPASAVQIHNPLTADLTHMRPSLMPSLLRSIERNQGERAVGMVFELQRVYVPQKDDLPEERTELVVAHYGADDVENAFLQIKGGLMSLADMAGITFTFERVADDGHWHSTRSAKILVDGRDVGRIGQVASKYTQAFGIDKDVMCAMLDFQTLVHGMEVTRRYEPIPEFPGIDRDIAVIVDAGLAYGDLVVAVEGADELIRSVKLVEVYRGKGIDEGKKSVTLSMHLRSDSKTLESQDADGAMGRVEAILTGQFSGIIR